MGRKFGLSFSLKRATGMSSAKGKLSRAIGVPLTKSGRERKVGRAVGRLGLGSLFAFTPRPSAGASATTSSMGRGACPFCGLAFNCRASSVGTMKRCDGCGEKFVLHRKPRLLGRAVALAVFGLGLLALRSAWTSAPPKGMAPSPSQPRGVVAPARPVASVEPPPAAAAVAPPTTETRPDAGARAAAAARLEAGNPEYRVYKAHASNLKARLEKAKSAADPTAGAIAAEYEQTAARLTKLEDDQMSKGK